jgi:hypothetical protein
MTLLRSSCFAVLLLLAACGPSFVVTGVSGKNITLDRTWKRGCVPGSVFAPDAPVGVWVNDQRTLTGLELVTTLDEYDNGSTTPDCSQGHVHTTTLTQELKNDHVQVPISWVDVAGNPAAAPAGLEGVTHANGASGLMTVATRTPLSQASADALNTAAFCGLTGWAPNVAKNLLDCFTGGVNPAPGTIVVDDRASTWQIYDGVGADPTAYPTFMPNALPHAGPF